MQKILILNDHSDLLEIIEMILFHRGYYIISNILLPDLSAVISKHKPGLILLHYFSGKQELKAYYNAVLMDPYAKYIPMLIIAREGETFDDCIKSENNYFIPKQLNTKDLIDTIENLLKTDVE